MPPGRYPWRSEIRAGVVPVALRGEADQLKGLGKRLDREADRIEPTLQVDVQLSTPGMGEPARQKLQGDLETCPGWHLEKSMGAGAGPPETPAQRRAMPEA